jgi:Skp family chaperone for outer membrane proteins
VFVNDKKLERTIFKTTAYYNEKIKNYADKNSIGIVIRDVVSYSASNDITGIISGSEPEKKNDLNNSQIHQNKVDGNFIRVGYVNSIDLLKSQGASSKDENKSIIGVLNNFIKKYAESNNIDLIIQEAVYVAPNTNCTNQIIGFISNESSKQDSKIKCYLEEPINSIAFLDSKSLMKESKHSLEASDHLKEKYKDREAKLKQLQEASDPEFMREKIKFDKELDIDKATEYRKVLEILNAKLGIYRTEKNIGLIVQKAIYVSPRIDITKDFLKEVNN